MWRHSVSKGTVWDAFVQLAEPRVPRMQEGVRAAAVRGLNEGYTELCSRRQKPRLSPGPVQGSSLDGSRMVNSEGYLETPSFHRRCLGCGPALPPLLARPGRAT